MTGRVTGAPGVWRTLRASGCRAEVVSVTPLDAFENDVFLVETSDETDWFSVVRVSRPGERSLAEVRAEVEFVRLLADAGLRVARPLGGPADLGGAVGVWFRYVAGRQAATVREVSARHAFELGRAMARMHTVAQDAPDPLGAARPAWWEASHLRLDALRGVAGPDVLTALRGYRDEVRRRASGELLVHGDLGPGNVIIGSALHVIDFDDACRAEPEYDLAVVLVRLFTTGVGDAADVERTVPHLVAGYRDARGAELNPGQVDGYARILLLQSAIAACRRPGCPGLTAEDALARAWTAIGEARTMPGLLRLAVERLARALR